MRPWLHSHVADRHCRRVIDLYQRLPSRIVVEESNMSRPQRRKRFIDSNVQGALARRIIFHWLVFLLVASLAAFLLQVLSDPFRPLASTSQNLWWTHGPFLLVMVFLLPVFVVDTIKISHRFAGPIFSLRRAMREVAAGQAAAQVEIPPPRFLARPGRRLQRHAGAARLLDDEKPSDADEPIERQEQAAGRSRPTEIVQRPTRSPDNHDH